MSDFIVSARKYRPQRFDEVVGQQHVSLTLKNALQTGHLAHAFLFCGPRGVGKTTCARILAKVINCENPTDDYEACNVCSSCQAFSQNASFNITELDAASNNSVEHIRALIEQVRFQPQQGRYKVFIIDEVHMLSQQAFNAFLKTLEEPPSYAIFILATTEKHKIIPTILSRCQIFDFRRIQVSAIVDHLQQICQKEGIQADKNALHIIAQKADGALRDALSIFDRMISFSSNAITYESVIQNLNVLDYDYYFKIVDFLLSENLSQTLLLFDEILNKGFESDIFLLGLAEHLRNVLVCKDPLTVSLLEVSEEVEESYKNQAALAPKNWLLSALDIANDCDVNFKMAKNKRLHVEMALMKMAYINSVTTIQQAAPQTTQKKTPEQSSSPQNPVIQQSPQSSQSSQSNNPTIQQPQNPSTQKSPNTPPIKQSKKFNTPKIASIDALAKEMDSKKETASQSVQPLNLELVLKTWKEYADTLQSPSAKNALYNANVEIGGDRQLLVKVASGLNKGLIQQETTLMDHLRQVLQLKNLELKIIIDETLTPKKTAKKPKKPLTVKEKYDKMVQANPLVQEFRKRFDLKADQE